MPKLSARQQGRCPRPTPNRYVSPVNMVVTGRLNLALLFIGGDCPFISEWRSTSRAPWCDGAVPFTAGVQWASSSPGGAHLYGQDCRLSSEGGESSYRLQLGLGGIKNGHLAWGERGSTALRDFSSTMFRSSMASMIVSRGIFVEHVLPR